MTILLKRYSGFSPELFERGIAPTMRDCTLRLYLLLCRESDRMSSRRVSFTDGHARAQGGISQTSMRAARRELKALGIAVFTRNVGGHYTYELCDLDTKQPYPGDPKQKPVRVRKQSGPTSESPNPFQSDPEPQPLPVRREAGPAREAPKHHRASTPLHAPRNTFATPELSPSGKPVYFPMADTEFPFGANVD